MTNETRPKMTTTLNSAPKIIPAVSDEQIAKYNTTYYSCDCQDRAIRGGSYIVDGQRVCKHMARQRSPKALVGPVRVKAFADYAESQKPSPVLEWVAFIELDPFAAFS